MPGFGLAYLWAGPPRIWRRMWQLLAAIGGLVARRLVGGRRPADPGGRPAVLRRVDEQQHPAARLRLQRPWPARRQRDRVDRSSGQRRQRLRRRRPGSPGCSTSEFGGQISWLLPAALIALVALLWVSRRAARTDRTRAAALLWGGWLLVTGLTFSYMQRHHPPVLHGRTGPGDRGAGRRRRDGAVGARGWDGSGGRRPRLNRGRHRAGGRWSCSAGRHPGCRGCAG